MKKMPPNHPEDSDEQLDSILGSRLRSTSPEFEQRFNTLSRRLANEESASPWRRWWQIFSHPDARAWQIVTVATAMIALVAVIALQQVYFSASEQPDTKDFLELVALDESLSSALVLSDQEALDLLLNMPVN